MQNVVMYHAPKSDDFRTKWPLAFNFPKAQDVSLYLLCTARGFVKKCMLLLPDEINVSLFPRKKPLGRGKKTPSIPSQIKLWSHKGHVSILTSINMIAHFIIRYFWFLNLGKN